MAAAPRQERLGRAELAGRVGRSQLDGHAKYIFDLEMSKASAPRVLPFGVTMVAPVIMKYGSQAQKEQYLPDIRESKVWWCQGYSSPAPARTSPPSDHGQARRRSLHRQRHENLDHPGPARDMIFCLVRTSKEEKRQDGISFLLIDMKSEGITVNPIVTIDNPRPGTRKSTRSSSRT